MEFPEKDAYMLQTEGCTFYIERIEDGALWRLSYQVFKGPRSGHYHYRRCSSPAACAALLAGAQPDDADWKELWERAPFLHLPFEAAHLAKWSGSTETPSHQG